jgi:hypothetical protein
MGYLFFLKSKYIKCAAERQSRSASTPLRGGLLPKAGGSAIYKTEAGIDVG